MLVKQNNKSGRQHLLESFGSDTKFLSHGFRLVRQGKELLETGYLRFPRPDAKFLRDIKEGKIYTKDNLEDGINQWNQENQSLDEALVNSILPDKADFDYYNKLLIEIFDNYVT